MLIHVPPAVKGVALQAKHVFGGVSADFAGTREVAVRI